ncbi:sodium-dependent transporter [Natronospora cellulosivora (SeqCode)]
MQNNLERENWTSKLGFILAAAGSAVGLGNIWRFPYVTGVNGGALFLLLYLVAIILIGYPVMITEVTIGRKAQRNPVGAFKAIAPDTPWWLVGGLGVFTGFVILSYYSVVAGWSLEYIVKSIGGFAGVDTAELFVNHITGFPGPLIWHAIFMALCIIIISAGVVKGIQKAVKVLMPVLAVLLVLLVVRSVTLSGAAEGLRFMFSPDFSEITWSSVNAAIGQAFFTLSLGMGAMITYGSYLSKKENINDNVGFVVGIDTMIAIFAGLAIFPAVFALGMDPGAGAGLTFITLPAVFAEMPLGGVFAFSFFVLLSIAALTSAISLLEVVVAYMVDEKGWARPKAAAVIGIIIFTVGLIPLLGYSVWDNVEFLGMDLLDTFDWFANDIFLPLGGLLTAIFAGYIWGTKNVQEEANRVEGKITIGAWYGVFIRYIVPVAIAFFLVFGAILPKIRG